jgi:hypothetical protein
MSENGNLPLIVMKFVRKPVTNMFFITSVLLGIVVYMEAC